MTEQLEGCEKELYDRRFADTERRLDELTENYRILDLRTAEQGGLIKSIDGRMTDLVKDTTAQTAKLDRMEKDNTDQNSEIITKVERLDNTLTDYAQNGAEATRQIKVVKDSVGTLSDKFEQYVEKNRPNMKRVETIGDGVVRIEAFLIAAYNEVKGVLRKLLNLGLFLAAVWLLYRFFPGLKPFLSDAIKEGGLAE